MSRIMLMEVVMENDLPDLYEIYFSGKVPIYYNDEIPFIVVGASSEMGEEAGVELMSGCKQFKVYHQQLFGIEVKAFVTDKKKFSEVKNWWNYFHPNGIYR